MVLLVAHVVIGFTAAVIISARRTPSAAIAGVLAIVFIPFLGAVWFLLVGTGRLPKARRDIQVRVNELVSSRTTDLGQVSHRDEWPAWLARPCA